MSTKSSWSGVAGIFHRLRKGVRILVLERRIPGAALSHYYSIQKSLGRKMVKLRAREGLSLECLTGSLSMFVEVFHKEVYKFENLNLNDAIVVDIGGNQGFFSLYAASRGALVYAFEPCAENSEIFEKNIARNQLMERISIIRAAVTGGAELVYLFVGFDRTGDVLSGSASIMNANRGGASIDRREVPGVPINKVLDFVGVDRCDLMKIDCEGAEYEIIEAATLETLQKVDRLVIEFHRGDADKIVDKLVASGFSVESVEAGQAGLIKVMRHSSVGEPSVRDGEVYGQESPVRTEIGR